MKLRLSPYQKIFYHEWTLNPASYQYNIVFDQTLDGSLNVERLTEALHRFIEDYLILNSHPVEIGEEVFWVQNDTITPLSCFERVISTTITEKISNYVIVPFNLARDSLYRFGLFHQEDGSYRFVVVLHHIIIDGNNFDTLIHEISRYYNDKKYHCLLTLEEQTKKLALETDELYTSLEKVNAEYHSFWQTQLRDSEAINLKFMQKHVSEYSVNCIETIKEVSFDFNQEIFAKFEKIKKHYNISAYYYGQMIFALLIYQYTAQKQFAISYPIAIEKTMGLIYGTAININIFLYQMQPEASVIDLIMQIKQFIELLKKHDFPYSYYPINYITLHGKKELLSVFFVQTTLKNEALTFESTKVLKINHEFNIDFFGNLLFEQQVVNDVLNYRVRYVSSVIDETLLNRFIQQYQALFVTVLHDLLSENTTKKIKDYSLLGPQEYQQVIYDWNKTVQPYEVSKTIHQLFEEQALKTPDNIAFVYEEKQWTYQHLNEKVNQLAHYLTTHYCIVPDDAIILFLNRNEWMIIAILAVLKTGAAYLPIVPSYPENRIQFILENSNANLTLTQKNLNQRLVSLFKHAIIIDSVTVQKEMDILPKTNPIISMSSNKLAYIIYTSGTTGDSKGVMLEHRGVVNLLLAQEKKLQLHNKKARVFFKCLCYANYGFDAHVFELFSALCHGHTVYLISEEIRTDFFLICDYIKKNNIHVATMPPALLEEDKLPELDIMFVAGDILDSQILKFYEKNDLVVINAYGPTETTVCATWHTYSPGDFTTNIGKPIDNIQVYVLNDNLNPLPVGTIGELYIGGVGVARGYVNALTSFYDSFIANPFQENTRLYKTGDLVRWTPTGELEYVGRNDSQVKIRGYRVEVKEIENKLIGYEGIKQAFVIAKDYLDKKNDKYLAAYYIASAPLDSQLIKNYLSAQLPDYMCPSTFIYLKKFPLTLNEKIDFHALPHPMLTSYEQYFPPSNDKERVICEAFSKVLQIKPIGIKDDFFNLGGDSLDVIRLTSELQKYFSAQVTDVFHFRTPKDMAKKLSYDYNILKKTLEHIKKIYQNTLVISEETQVKKALYLDSCLHSNVDVSMKKEIKSVLLTGGTGFLGCNLLRQLLVNTPYKLFLLVRAKTDKEAVCRINKKYQFYFNESLNHCLNQRVFVIKADLEKEQFGLTAPEYRHLSTKIDSVIHSAAQVKHYGEERNFYSTNVQATINLLEFSKLTRLRDFHYISTISVLEVEKNSNNVLYTEDCIPEHLKISENLYKKTKLLSEIEVFKYRQYGINSNIYRVGNLAFILENLRLQENIEESAFFNWLNCLIDIQYIAKEMRLVQISQVDLTAKAIISIFDKKILNNGIYHVFNPYLFDLMEVFKKNPSYAMKMLPMDLFIDNLFQYLSDDRYHELIFKILLQQDWLNGKNIKNLTELIFFQDRTQTILKKLNFEWPQIKAQDFHYCLNHISQKKK